MGEVVRYDAVELRMDKAQETPEGWLRVPAAVSRVGVFPYRRADGSIRMELRREDEVFGDDSVRSFSLLPLTNDHPPGRLDAANVKKYQVGQVGQPRRDGDHLVADVLITDAAAIADARSGKRQLSPGYTVDLEETPGVWRGQRYDAVQRNPRGNHYSMVQMGRQGPTVELRMDSGDAVQGVAQAAPTPPPREAPTMKKITLDGKEFEVADEVAAHIEKQDADIAKARTDAAQAKTDADKVRTDAESVPALKARVDALEEARKTDAEAFRTDAAQLADAVGCARLVIADDYKIDGKDAAAVKLDVIGKVHPDAKTKLDALAKAEDPALAAHIAARFDVAMDAWREQGNKGKKLLKAAASAGRTDSAPQDPAAKAKAKAEQDRRDNYLKGQGKQPAA